MSSLERALRRLCEELSGAGFRFALVGGLAVSVRSEPRFTRDADMVISVDDDAHAESLVRALQSKDYALVALLEQEAVGRLATARLQPPENPGRGLVLDLLFASSGIENEVVDGAENLDVLPGLSVPVASLGHLIALKVLSRDDIARPQDIVDLRALVRRATDDEVESAQDAVRLVEARGFQRGRDLVSSLEKLLKEEDGDS